MNTRHQGTEAVLSVNTGSSSLKFAVYPVEPAPEGDAFEVGAPGLSGQAEGLEPGGQPVITVSRADGSKLRTLLQPAAGESSFAAALRVLIETLASESGLQLRAVAHRIVHGGKRFSDSVLIDDEVLAYLDSLNPLAPLHQPHNLAGVRAMRQARPDLPQVACFDTAFHATAPEVETRFALPERFWQEGVRRYGFHGLSYRYVSERLTAATPRARGRLLLAHLGNGASLCAVRKGRSIATSMGFSALDGLMMGTRCGTLDAGVLLHLMRQGWTADQIEQLLYKKSGLLGVSGISADMRTLRASRDPRAALAIEQFSYRVRRESGAMAACLGGVDLIGFTGGIGEHDAALRQSLCESLAHLGVRIDGVANQTADGSGIAAIHEPGSAVEVWVVPTDEGRVAARDAVALTTQDAVREALAA